MTGVIDLYDLRAVAQFAGSFVLFVHKNDIGREKPLCTQLNMGMKRFDVVQPLGNYLKFNPFEPVDHTNEELHRLYHRAICDHLEPEEILRLMHEFSDKTGYIDE